MKIRSKIFLLLTIITTIFTLKSAEIKVNKELELNKELFQIINLPSEYLPNFIKKTKKELYKDYRDQNCDITKAGVIKALIDAGADVNNYQENGMTPLMHVIAEFTFAGAMPRFDRNSLIDTIAVFLNSDNLDINLGYHGNGRLYPQNTTVLMMAVQNRIVGINVLKLLLTKNPYLFAKDARGKTALDYAYGKKKQLLTDYIKNYLKPVKDICGKELDVYFIPNLSNIQLEYLFGEYANLV